MEELSRWLGSQHSGLVTYQTFYQRVLTIGAKSEDQVALCSLLAALVDQFIEIYDEEPLPSDVADEAYGRLAVLMGMAAKFNSLKPEQKLEALNDIAAAKLN